MKHDYIEENMKQRKFLDPITQKKVKCRGLMDVPLLDLKTNKTKDPPSRWSECSVSDFRKAYIAKQLENKCFKGRDISKACDFIKVLISFFNCPYIILQNIVQFIFYLIQEGEP